MNSYSIYSLSGSEIKGKSKINTNIINTNFLTTGVYIMLFNNFNGGVFSKKILIE